MPIQKRWSPFTIEKLSFVPNESGIYELGGIKREIVYIGSGDSEHGVRGTLYYHKKNKPRSVKYFRFMLVSRFESPIEMEQEHCELFRERYGRLPKLQKRIPRGYMFRLI